MLISKTRNQKLRHKIGDLLFREINNTHNLPADQFIPGIMISDLRARPLYAVFAKINLNFISRFACPGKICHLQYGSGAQLYFLKIGPVYGLH